MRKIAWGGFLLLSASLVSLSGYERSAVSVATSAADGACGAQALRHEFARIGFWPPTSDL